MTTQATPSGGRYAEAGVDIDAGHELVSHIGPLANATRRTGWMGALGGFGGLFDLAACGFKDLAPDRVNIVLATASPAKFPETIQRAIGLTPTHPSLEALKSKPIVKHRLKATPDAIRAFIDARAVR